MNRNYWDFLSACPPLPSFFAKSKSHRNSILPVYHLFHEPYLTEHARRPSTPPARTAAFQNLRQNL